MHGTHLIREIAENWRFKAAGKWQLLTTWAVLSSKWVKTQTDIAPSCIIAGSIVLAWVTNTVIRFWFWGWAGFWSGDLWAWRACWTGSTICCYFWAGRTCSAICCAFWTWRTCGCRILCWTFRTNRTSNTIRTWRTCAIYWSNCCTLRACGTCCYITSFCILTVYSMETTSAFTDIPIQKIVASGIVNTWWGGTFVCI